MAQAVCAALVARANGHGGQHVEVAMVDAAIHFLWTDGMWNHIYLDHESNVPDLNMAFHIYATRDGWVLFYPIAKERHWHRALEALGRSELEDDPRFNRLDLRSANMPILNAELSPTVAQYTTAELVELMDGLDVPASPVHTREQVVADAHVQAREILVETDHPTAGPRPPGPLGADLLGDAVADAPACADPRPAHRRDPRRAGLRPRGHRRSSAPPASSPEHRPSPPPLPAGCLPAVEQVGVLRDRTPASGTRAGAPAAPPALGCGAPR